MTGPYAQSDKARIVFALLAAQLLLLTAALWHHHGHDRDAEHPHHPVCAVCIAVECNTTDTTVAAPGPAPAAPVGIVIESPRERIASRRPDRTDARGPPPTIA